MIELRLLQAATTVADERNVTRAAERLSLTQPALSKQLGELEERVGFALFERTSQRFAITAAGEIFVQHARNALIEIERAVHDGRAAALGSEDVLCIAKSPYVDPYFISMIGVVRLPLHPKLELRFSSHFSSDSLRMLRSGEVDMAVTAGLNDQSGLTSIKLSEDAFFVALPSSHPLCEKRELQLSDLHNHRRALFERHVNPFIYDKIQQLLKDDGIHPSETQHVQQAEEAAALLIQRGSLALLTKTGAWRISDGRISIRPLNDQRLIIKTYLSSRLDEQSRLVADFTRAFMRKLTPPPEQARLALAV